MNDRTKYIFTLFFAISLLFCFLTIALLFDQVKFFISLVRILIISLHCIYIVHIFVVLVFLVFPVIKLRFNFAVPEFHTFSSLSYISNCCFPAV